MNKNNPIVYFEEDGDEALTSHGWCGKILDVIPHMNDSGRLVAVDCVSEHVPKFDEYHISYQESFKIRFLKGQEFEFKGINGDVQDDTVFNNKFLQFIEDFHSGKYEYANFQLTSEVEFMDI